MNRNMQKKSGKNKFLDDFEGVFETKISRFNWAKCHIKLNHAIYMGTMGQKPRVFAKDGTI